MVRVAVSGIPNHWHRAITGSQFPATIYREMFPEVKTKRDINSQLGKISNTGNYLIGEGVARALSTCQQQHIPFPWLAGQDGEKWIDYINNAFDFFVFGTANIFHPSLDPSAEGEVIRKINIPIILMSAGIQNASAFGYSYPPQFNSFLDVLKEKNCHVFTRGEITADFLRKQGLSHVEPTGCPSLFAYPNKVVESLRRLKKIDWQKPLDIVHAGYLGSVADAVVDINALGGTHHSAAYVLQDETNLFEFNIDCADDGTAYDETNGKIVAPVSYRGQENLKKELSHHMFFSTEQWRTWTGRFDFSFGRRFHGGVMAAQAGVPFVVLAVDDRTREMLSFAKLPHMEARDWNPLPNKAQVLEKFVTDFDVDFAITHYETMETRFRQLLGKIGIVAPQGAAPQAGKRLAEAV
jgi:hypothetical protein